MQNQYINSCDSKVPKKLNVLLVVDKNTQLASEKISVTITNIYMFVIVIKQTSI